MHTNSEKSDDASGAAKIRVGVGLALLLAFAVSTTARAETPATPVDTVSGSDRVTVQTAVPATGQAQPQAVVQAADRTEVQEQSQNRPGNTERVPSQISAQSQNLPPSSDVAQSPGAAPTSGTPQTVVTAAAKPPVLTDFSPLALYHHADQIVKAVILMHSFISIAQSQTTNLSVVAPGIAEALFATALGLVVAIPAVILYNVIGRLITGYRLLLADSMTLTLCLLSHDLDALEQNAHPLLTSAA